MTFFQFLHQNQNFWGFICRKWQSKWKRSGKFSGSFLWPHGSRIRRNIWGAISRTTSHWGFWDVERKITQKNLSTSSRTNLHCYFKILLQHGVYCPTPIKVKSRGQKKHIFGGNLFKTYLISGVYSLLLALSFL